MKNENYPLYKVEQISNLKELINRAAGKYSDKPAFVFERDNETVSISYRQFKMEVDALGTAFYDTRIQNAKIALLGENSYEWVLTYFAVVNSGNVIVPLDKELPAAEIKNIIDHSEAEVFVYSDTYADYAEYLQQNGANVKHYINLTNDLRELLEKGDYLVHYNENSVVDYKVDNDALTALMYTSGTTGKSKGVMLSHRNLAANTVGSSQNYSFLGSNLLVLPLHHSLSLTAGVLIMMIQSSTIAINRSLKDIQKDIQKYKPHNIFVVPLLVETFYKQILAAAKGKDDKKLLKKIATAALGENLTTLACGGAPLDKKYIVGFRDIGIFVLEGYGITECAPVVAVNRNHWYRDGSVGQVLPCCEVKIIEPDENGNGEVCVKGDIVMLGYYKNEQATAEAFDGEWFKTGDIGYLDKDGFLFISGRKKNLILLSNGKNVYPEELEFELLKHIPYVKEVVVYAEDNEIVAEVFLDTDNDPDCATRLNGDIAAFNQTQAPYKNIGRVVIRDTEFPKTTTKKIKRQYT